MCGIACISISNNKRQNSGRKPCRWRKDTPPRSGLEWHLLRWKRHTGTRASFHRRSAIRRATPLLKRRKKVLAVNGEIYNHRDIRAQYAGKYNFQTGSDCEVILALYQEKGIHFLEDLSGILHLPSMTKSVMNF